MASVSLRAALAAALVAAAVIPATASAAPGQLAQGSGESTFAGDRFLFNAEGTFGAPIGSVRFDAGPLKNITGNVDCLRTGTKLAVVSGRINNPAAAGGFDRYTLVVEDNKGAKPDRINSFLANGNFCPSFTAASNAPLNDVKRGDILIRRAT